MAGHDHRRAILRLTGAGRLDEALAELTAADAAGSPTSVTILVQLARALLEAGRQQDALELLDRAAALSPFDQTVLRVTTEVGQPVRTPSGAPALGSSVDELLARVTPTEPFDLRDTVEGAAYDSSPTIDLSAAESRELLVGRQTEDRSGSGATPTDVSLPSPGSRAGFDADQSLEPPLEDVPLDEAALPPPRPGDSAETRPVLLPGGEDQADTDEVMLPRRDEGAAGAPVPLETDPEPVRPAEDDASTRVLVLEGLAAPSLEHGPPVRDTTPTRSIDLAEVQVVGFFEAGKGGGRGGAQQAAELSADLEHDGPVDFSRVPDSDTLERRLLEREGRRGERHAGAPQDSPGGPERERQPAGEEPRAEPSPTASPRPVTAPTDRVLLPRLQPRRLLRRGAPVVIVAACLALVVVVASGVFGWVALRHRAEDREVAAVGALLRDDAFASHREALASLGRLAGRYPHGLACAEHGVEAATMWGRFGLGEEHAETARRALETCGPRGEAGGALSLVRVLLLLHGGEAELAAAAARGALSTRPDDVRLRTALGLALEAQGDLGGAARELALSRGSDPTFVPATLALARLHRRAGRRGEAELMLEEVRRQSPRHAEAAVEELMLALDAAGDRPRDATLAALRAMATELETAVQDEPPAIVARALVARGRLRLAQDDVDPAGQLLARALRLGPPPEDAAIHVARGLRLSGDLAGALVVSSSSRAEDPELRLERTRVLLAAGRPAPALVELAQLRRAPMERASVARLEAEARLQAGDPVAAAAVLAAVVEETPDSRTLVALSDVQLARGRGEEAQRILARVSSRPFAACAEARRLELRGDPRRALGVLDERGEAEAACTLRVRSLVAARLGETITEISKLRALLRTEPRFEDRTALVRAVWRQRGARAAEAEARTMLEAPPTGVVPLLQAVDLLAETGNHGRVQALLEGAREAGAGPGDLAAATARLWRRRGQPQAALDGLEEQDLSAPAVRLERAAALVALGRHGEALTLLGRPIDERASPSWVEAQLLEAQAIGQSQGRLEADRHLDRALRECLAAGNAAGAQELALGRVEMAADAGASSADLRGLLRLVPPWPPTARTAHLAGRLAEGAGDVAGARRAYEAALAVEPTHVPSLTRLNELTDSPELRRLLRTLSPEAPLTEAPARRVSP